MNGKEPHLHSNTNYTPCDYSSISNPEPEAGQRQKVKQSQIESNQRCWTAGLLNEWTHPESHRDLRRAKPASSCLTISPKSCGSWNRTNGLLVQSQASLPAATIPHHQIQQSTGWESNPRCRITKAESSRWTTSARAKLLTHEKTRRREVRHRAWYFPLASGRCHVCCVAT